MKTADIVVIGGGIAGISAAAEMSKDAAVVLLEAEPVTGYHSTGRSAAVFIRNYGNATLRQLNAAAQPHLDEGGYLRQRGELLLALPGQEKVVEDHLAMGPSVSHLSEAEAREMVPILRPGRFVGAAFEREAHDIDVDLLMQDYLRVLRGNGGEVITDARVTALRRDGAVWICDHKGGSVAAPVVVNAAGAWADEVAEMAGAARVGLRPCRRSAAIVPLPEHDLARWPLFAGAAEDWYGKPEAGKLMVSPADEDEVAPQDAWPEDMVLAEGIHRFEQATTIEVTRVERTWAGLRTFAPDRTPVVGFDPSQQAFFWLAGQGGYGVQTAPALSRLTADLCLKRAPGLAADTVTALSPHRF